MRKPMPIKLTGVTQEALRGQLNVQTIQKSNKSADPKNFPVFDIPVEKKVLIYVPNHVVEGEYGPELRMDKPLIHTIQDGKRYGVYRCVSGIVLNDENGNPIYNGSCPLCDGVDVPWELANLKIASKCAQMALDPDDVDNPSVKAIRSAEFSDRVLKESNRYYTFPICVFDTVNNDGKTLVKDEEGKPVITIMWYHISENQYKKKWETCLEGMEDEPIHPGGHFFVLNFIYDTKGKQANKRDAAQNLTVISRTIKNSDKLKAMLDEATVDWTPEKAQETVISNQLYSLEDLQEITDDLLSTSRDTIALMNASNLSKKENASVGELKAPAGNAIEENASVMPMDETDADDSLDFE